MNRFKKIIGIFLLCLFLPFTLAAKPGADNQEVDAFSYVNTSSLGWKIGHFAYWEDTHAKIHRPYNQMTRIECGWNYYLMSLVDPIYDEAKAELEKEERITSKSPDMSIRYQSFNPQKGTFEFKLNLSTTGVNVDIPITIAYKDLTGDPWPSSNNYVEYNAASSRARKLSNNFQTNSNSLLADAHYVLTYIPQSRRYTATVKDIKIYDTNTKKLIYSSNEPAMRSFVANPSKSTYYRGDILFNESALEKRVTAVNPQKFGLTSNPFGLSYTYKELNEIFGKASVRDRKLEIEELHENEEKQVKQLEESMKQEILHEYELKKKLFEKQQEKEDAKQAKYDEAFEKECNKILSKKPGTEITWKEEYVGADDYWKKLTIIGGVGFPFGSVYDQSISSGMLLYGNVKYGNGLRLDAYGSGGFDLSSAEYKPEYNGSGTSSHPEDVPSDYAPLFTAYIGGGPVFGSGKVSISTTGGLSLGMIKSNHETALFVEPAAKIDLQFLFTQNYDTGIGMEASVLFHGNAIEAIIGVVCELTV